MNEFTDASETVGYAKPPRSSRFKTGQSGNPRGRPRGRHRDVPYDQLLGQMVVVREDGRERRVTAAEAFLLHLTKRGMEGDSASARATLAAIEEARSKRQPADILPTKIVLRSVTPGSVGCALEALGMAHKLNGYSERARLELNPWLVQQALSKLGPRQLTPAEQTVVIKATRTPQKVAWPDWWTVKNWTDLTAR